jgi:hypothetical protein
MLKLVKHGTLEILKEYRFSGKDKLSRVSIVNENKIFRYEDWRKYNFDRRVRSRLNKLINALWEPLLTSYYEWDNDCILAYQYFARANMGDFFEREVDLWISLESMFGPEDRSGELKYYLCQNTSFFTCRESERRVKFEFLKKKYNARCDIVHGSEKRLRKVDLEKPFSEMYEEYCALEDIVRIALRRYLFCRIVKKMKKKEIHSNIEEGVFNRRKIKKNPDDPLNLL